MNSHYILLYPASLVRIRIGDRWTEVVYTKLEKEAPQ